MMKVPGGIVLLVVSVICGSRPCPENCKKNLPLSTCNTDTGVCSRGCVPGYYGNTCNMTCDVNCERGLCQWRDGSCTCKAGYTYDAGSCVSLSGVTCESNENCLNNKCLSARRPDCLEGCKPGSFGKFCQRSCSSHCFCDEVSGNCRSCIQGWYGAECGSRCSPGCVDKECDRNGSCSTGCGKGFYGEKCESNCPEQCTDDWCGENGTCNTCRPGFYGYFCRQTCHRCTENVCEIITGECIMGCQRSYYGPGCSKTCDRCIDGVCNGTTGECVRGCKSGYYGPGCRRTCGTCIDGVCNSTTGECFKGCEGGYYGSFCNLTCEHCKDDDCVQDTGECRYRDEEGENWTAIGGGVAVVIFILIAVGMFYMFRRLKRVNSVVYDIAKWRRRPPSAVEDARPMVDPRYIELEEEGSTNPPRVCPIRPVRQTSYIEPQHSGGSVNNLQRHLQAVGVSDQQEDEHQAVAVSPSYNVRPRFDESHDRPDSYVMPNYCEVNEELMATPPQAPHGAEAPAPVVNFSSFSVVANVHAQHEHPNDGNADLTCPLIAECFGPTETGDSSPDEEPRPNVENYEHPFKNHYTQF